MPFHLYGFIIGSSVVIGLTLAEKQARAHAISEQEFWRATAWILTGGILGARLWHVGTDFYLYQNSLIDVIKIWQGGLSILGALLGGLISVTIYLRLIHRRSWYARLLLYLDLSIFGLPLAQAMGRLGNWVNHELYGLPTNLPWAISIPLENRAAGYQAAEFFHPLFAYEAILTGLFGLGVWLIFYKKLTRFPSRLRSSFKVGTGRLFSIYLTYYLIIRFWLDFLRPEKVMLDQLKLGLNQLIILLLLICLGVLQLRRYFDIRSQL